MKANGWMHWLGCALLATTLAACSSGPVRRVSEPAARIQQLTVNADGSWTAQLRIENYSSIPMRFDRVELAMQTGGHDAGTLQASPALDIGPESADVVEVRMAPSAAAKLAAADALAASRALPYFINGTVTATPEEARKSRQFEVEYRSSLNPAPGLPGVLR